GLLDAAAEDRLRGGSHRQRPSPAVRRGAARAGLPRGAQGHREALQGPLQAPPLRPRRVRGGGDARPRADRAGVRGGRRGGRADLRPGGDPPAPDGAHLLPDHPYVPGARAAGLRGAVPAGEVQDPLPRADRVPARGDVRGQVARADDRARGPRADPGERVGHGAEANLGLVRLMETSRVLITGLSTYWGGRLAQALEQSDAI